MQPDVDATDHEYAIFGFLDFTDGLAAQAVAIGLDPARLQRASEGSRQSAGHSGDDVVEGRGVRLERCGRDLVVPRHGHVVIAFGLEFSFPIAAGSRSSEQVVAAVVTPDERPLPERQ